MSGGAAVKKWIDHCGGNTLAITSPRSTAYCGARGRRAPCARADEHPFARRAAGREHARRDRLAIETGRCQPVFPSLPGHYARAAADGRGRNVLNKGFVTPALPRHTRLACTQKHAQSGVLFVFRHAQLCFGYEQDTAVADGGHQAPGHAGCAGDGRAGDVPSGMQEQAAYAGDGVPLRASQQHKRPETRLLR